MNQDHKDNLTQILEEYNLPPSAIDEIVGVVFKGPLEALGAPTDDVGAFQVYMRAKMASEPSWRARAAMAASIISKRLQDGY